MKIIDIIKADKPSLSFEVFPPKTETKFESVKTAVEEIAKLKPAFMSVTYGAGGGTSKYTLDIAKNIKAGEKIGTLTVKLNDRTELIDIISKIDVTIKNSKRRFL